jgi:uncharacterized protein YdaU (DUF1376 family)
VKKSGDMELPDPPVPADADLRDFDGFMLNVERLLASELWALASGEEFKAAVGLWCRSWKQVPPGSLPNDDRVLAAFSGAGRRWKTVRNMAMRGFYLCSDGRLYHRVLCEDVLRAMKAKEERRERTRAATEARKKKRDDNRDDTRGENRNDARDAQRDVGHKGNVTTSHRQDRTGQEERKKEPSPPPSPDPAPAVNEAAEAVVKGFLELRDKHWPNDSRLPAPLMTIESEAAQFLEKGGNPDLIGEIVDRSMAKAVVEGKGPPNSLRAYGHSIANGIAGYAKPVPTADRMPDIPAALDRRPKPETRALAGRPIPATCTDDRAIEMFQRYHLWLNRRVETGQRFWSEGWGAEPRERDLPKVEAKLAELERRIWPDATQPDGGSAETLPTPDLSGGPKPAKEA